MLIVHIITTQDTKDFEKIYDGMLSDSSVSILINPSKLLLFQEIIKENNRTIICKNYE